MRIIKPGDINKLDPEFEFTCSYCGCVFVVSRKELLAELSIHNDSYLKHSCPTCNTLVYEEI